MRPSFAPLRSGGVCGRSKASSVAAYQRFAQSSINGIVRIINNSRGRCGNLLRVLVRKRSIIWYHSALIHHGVAVASVLDPGEDVKREETTEPLL